ncbi:hypothetical protein OGAPHI_000040 [Ogataea philodendri]|uniref:DH domain-containing protein n=1 Tax=Ogataea philodendri TaxID=1378263 RepID=A0A9P8TAQ5_9ASCO|nr:uncharacterized protein OGAPHI_000040 [Ogataea philodendri]KAH3671854.1 hypothetical protein OGAPHI_000040 [Ogataea philodendri]
MPLTHTNANASEESQEFKRISESSTLASLNDSNGIENVNHKTPATVDALDNIDWRFDSTSSITINTKAPIDLNSELGNGSAGLEGPDTSLLSPLTPIKDASSSALKRSFTRQKQVKELLNTEEVYVKALKVLKEVYINYLSTTGPIPLFFGRFARAVDMLLEEHNHFLEGLVKLYHDWIKLGNSTETCKSSIHSPMFETHIPRSEDHLHLEKIADWILQNAISVPTYSSYCQLVPKILEFAESKNVNQYNASSIVIYNDYMVEHQDVASSYFLQQQLDIRFISLIQMPTNRISRYRLIADSLLQKSKDDMDFSLVEKLNKCVSTIGDKCTQINKNVGKGAKKEAQSQVLKQMMTSSIKQISQNPYYFDNMGYLTMVAAFATVWLNDESIKYEYLGSILFDSHLVLVRPYKHRQLGVKMVLPISSIFCIQDEDFGARGMLYTTYTNSFKIHFENNFKQYEIAVIFTSDSEKKIWLTRLNKAVSKWTRDIGSHHNFSYSYCKRQSRLKNSELENFRFSGFIPDDMTPYKVKSHSQYFALETNLRQFTVNNFAQSADDSLKRDWNSNPRATVTFKKEDRLRLEKVLAEFWEPEIPKTIGDLTRSISDFSLRKKLSISSISSMGSSQQQPAMYPCSNSLMRSSRGNRLSASSSMRNLAHSFGNLKTNDDKSEKHPGSASDIEAPGSRSGTIKKSFSFKKLIKSMSVHTNLAELQKE